MDEERINGLIGQLNLALIISNAADGDLITLPNEDAKELLICLETLKNYMTKG